MSKQKDQKITDPPPNTSKIKAAKESAGRTDNWDLKKHCRESNSIPNNDVCCGRNSGDSNVKICS